MPFCDFKFVIDSLIKRRKSEIFVEYVYTVVLMD